ncbi:MAG TPA: PQQ-dependent sugar dehydrogenase [Candidatus Limnocylindria bacterium]|nr:PQQ-dependent sugar dehydrogenase [Candidatus Limnocylindria bacterium]
MNIVQLRSNTLDTDTSDRIRSNHDAGPIVFGQDGTLFIVNGDQNVRGQYHNITDGPSRDDLNFAGAVLRLNDDGSIPEDNPFYAAAILRRLREQPNEFVDLAGLADGLGEDPFTIQVHLKQMARRKLVTTSFIEPSRAGAAELTERGHAWLLEREGGRPADPPVLLQPATAQTRHDGPRLPRAQVYGPGRASPDRIRVQTRV